MKKPIVLNVNNFDSKGHADNALYEGKNNEIITNWRVVCDRDIILRLVDKESKIWRETKFIDNDGGEDSKKVQLLIPENTPKGTGYKVVERIVPQGGSWDDSLAEEANDNWGRGITVN